MSVSGNGRILYYSPDVDVAPGLLAAYDLQASLRHEIGVYGTSLGAVISADFDSDECRGYWLRLLDGPARREPESTWSAELFELDACAQEPVPRSVDLELSAPEAELDTLPDSPVVAVSTRDRIILSSPSGSGSGSYELPHAEERSWKVYRVRLEEQSLHLVRHAVTGGPAIDRLTLDLHTGRVTSRRIVPLDPVQLASGLERHVDLLAADYSLRYVAAREGGGADGDPAESAPCRLTIYDTLDGVAVHELGEVDCEFLNASAVAVGKGLLVAHRTATDRTWRLTVLNGPDLVESGSLSQAALDLFSLEAALWDGRVLVKAHRKGDGGHEAILDLATRASTRLPRGSTFLGLGGDKVYVRLYDRLLEIGPDGEERIVYEVD